MRLIDLNVVESGIPGDWYDDAKAALEAVESLDNAPRAKAINSRSIVWSKLKQALADASDDKCWYCESRQIRADKAVDHFRPKNRVAESKNAGGYWWLAFDWHNYRYSCTFCNSHRRFDDSEGGKQDHFPLFDESTRGGPRATIDDLDQKERRQLLDPTDLDDVRLLTFSVNDGGAVAARTVAEDPGGNERALVSIGVYHLQEPGLRKARWERMREVRDLIALAEGLSVHDVTYRKAVARIYSSLAPDAEYSAAVKVMVRSLVGRSKLAEMILNAP